MILCRLPRSATFFTVAFLFGAAVHAEDNAFDWLVRINQATRTLNYDGRFVYQQGHHLQTLRVIHRVKDGVIQERLISLTGTPREVIRIGNEVRCYLPDQNSVVVEHRNTNNQSFPAILPESLRELENNYMIDLGKPGRVVGRTAQRVLIRPRDDYRYGYRLWADRATGLLLKAELINEKGSVLEQFMFTDIVIGKDISNSQLEPQTVVDGLDWYRDQRTQLIPAEQHWKAVRLPKGFHLSMSMTRSDPERGSTDNHMVYSDGLAAVSVFVKKLEPGKTPTLGGAHQVGALSVLGKPVDNHHITVVGEVPTKTIQLIGDSIARESE